MRVLLPLCLFLLPASACVAGQCSRAEAYAAEADTDHLTSWESVHNFYKKFSHCYDGAIAEGVQDRVQQLWADHWNELPSMIALTNRDVRFKEFVLRSLKTEAFPQDTFRRVLHNANTQCPAAAEEFCKMVRTQAAKWGVSSNMPIESGSPTAPTHLKRYVAR